jgi:glycosyltransferase involved in cell wall biosynthesis
VLLNQCDWWFAYTSSVKKFLVQNQFPASRITTVQNAIDTTQLARQYQSVQESEVALLKKELGIESGNVGLYVGGMYKEKRLDFLIGACDQIQAQLPDFHLILIGSGVEAARVKEAAASRSWLHYVGPKFGKEKVTYFKLAKLFLMPGLVGLAILDSFALQTPMITTDYPFHSPEIEYLENGVNGVITENNGHAYAQAVIQLLQDEQQRMRLIEGCKTAATRYTLDQMVHNYTEGILLCLGIQRTVNAVKVKVPT